MELEESALVDGLTRFQVLWKVVFPMARAGLFATAVFTFMFAWNDFIFALVLTRTDVTTFPVQVTHYFGGQSNFWAKIAAMSVLGTVPIFIAVAMLQRYLVAWYFAWSRQRMSLMTLTYDKARNTPASSCAAGRPVVSRVGLFEEWPLDPDRPAHERGRHRPELSRTLYRQVLRAIWCRCSKIFWRTLQRQAGGAYLRMTTRQGINSLHLVGREGLSMIAVAGLDMAAWDALAKAANMPLCVKLLGGDAWVLFPLTIPMVFG